MARARKFNSSRTDPSSAKYGVTKFSDLSQEEFAQKYLSPNLTDRFMKKSHRDLSIRKHHKHQMNKNKTKNRNKRATIDTTGLPLVVDWLVNFALITQCSLNNYFCKAKERNHHCCKKSKDLWCLLGLQHHWDHWIHDGSERQSGGSQCSTGTISLLKLVQSKFINFILIVCRVWTVRLMET